MSGRITRLAQPYLSESPMRLGGIELEYPLVKLAEDFLYWLVRQLAERLLAAVGAYRVLLLKRRLEPIALPALERLHVGAGPGLR